VSFISGPMDISINYPYGVPFYSEMTFIPVSFVNRSKDFFYIHFVKKKKVGDLAGIVFPSQNKKYHFPIKSIVAIILQDTPLKIQCYIKLRADMIYNYP
jgi:hypothetical protein